MNLILDSFLCCCFFKSPPRIKHANIVSLEEIFESKSHLYLVMQLWVFFRLSPSLLVPSPTRCMSHAINCTPQYTHMCRTARKRVHSQTVRRTCSRRACSWAPVGVLALTPASCQPPTHPNLDRNVMQKGQTGIGSTIHREAAENINH